MFTLQDWHHMASSGRALYGPLAILVWTVWPKNGLKKRVQGSQVHNACAWPSGGTSCIHACMHAGWRVSFICTQTIVFESLPLGDTRDDADNNKHQKPSHKHTNRETDKQRPEQLHKSHWRSTAMHGAALHPQLAVEHHEGAAEKLLVEIRHGGYLATCLLHHSTWCNPDHKNHACAYLSWTFFPRRWGSGLWSLLLEAAAHRAGAASVPGLHLYGFVLLQSYWPWFMSFCAF